MQCLSFDTMQAITAILALCVLAAAARASPAPLADLYGFMEPSACESLASASACTTTAGCSWCSSGAVGDSCLSGADAAALPAAVFACSDVTSTDQMASLASSSSSSKSQSSFKDERDAALMGEWQMVAPTTADSTVELFDTQVLLLLSRTADDTAFDVRQSYGAGASQIWMNFTVPAAAHRCTAEQPVGTHVFAENGFQGLRYLPTATLEACNVGVVAKNALQVHIKGDIHASSGRAPLHRALTFAPMAGKLLVTEQRASREGELSWSFQRVQSGAAKAAALARAEAQAQAQAEATAATTAAATAAANPAKKDKDAAPFAEHPQYTMSFDDDWTLDGTAPEKILLISLQAMANAQRPTLYFDYGPDWDFTYCKDILDYYSSSRDMQLQSLAGTAEALAALATPAVVSKYVVYDPAVRESIIVGMTLSGVYKALLVHPDLVALLPAGMTEAYDLRGQFTGQTPTEIYAWAYDTYKQQTSRSTLIWMGGECNDVMKPGVMDYGIRAGAFFCDLNTRAPDDPLSTPSEYALADRIMAGQDKYTMVNGWHSYCKDMERTFVTLSSHHALRVEGLHTIPNLSFNQQVPVSEGFVFSNNHNVQPGQAVQPRDRVYVSCVQTDALGLGAWVEPGRGAIPYAWETTLNFLWMQPAVLQYYYETATPNDYFIGALSGPGYMYPKAIPSADLPAILQKANEFVSTLDLRVFETMDYSEGSTVVGNTDLTREVVDTYYDQMPNILGFINGYSPSFTFDSRGGRPFVSFDYYLAPPPAAKTGGGSTDEALADLLELAALNKKDGEPYFLLMHVREWSNITRVQDLLARLPESFETVALDSFLSMAGQAPTFETHFAATDGDGGV